MNFPPYASWTTVSLIIVWLVILSFAVIGLQNDAGVQKSTVQPQETHLEAIAAGFCHQHYVKIKITNYTYEPMGLAWLENVTGKPYQITSGNFTIAGNTDENGVLTAPLCPSVKYKIEVANRTVLIYPSENDYQVMLR